MSSVDSVVDSLWENRIRWSTTADEMKRAIDRARAVVLGLGCWGATASATTASIVKLPGLVAVVVAASAAASLAVATYLASQFLMPESIRRWTRARAVSEGIKQEIYKYRARSAPYCAANAAHLLRLEVAALEESAEDLIPYLTARGRCSPSPTPMDPETYVRIRIEGQIHDFYLPRARRYATDARRLRRLALAFGLAATIAAAVNTASITGAYTTVIAPWVAVLTTIGGALAAHIANRRQDYLAISYTATAHRLNRLVTQWRADGSPTGERAWSAFVDSVEAAIASENDNWMAKWSEESPRVHDPR